MGSWNFSDIYAEVARQIPDAVALIQGDRKRIWRDLDRRATSIAACLVDAGLVRQDKVAQYLFNCVEYLESTLACFRGGFVPLNTNYRYGPDELDYLWNNGDVACVVFHGAFAATIEAVRTRVSRVKRWLWVDDGSGPCPSWAVPYELVAETPARADWRPWPVSGDDVLLLYTGGTTGLPKGVAWRQEDLFLRLNTENGDSFPEEADMAFLASKISRNGRAHLSAGPLMHGAGLLTCFMTLSRGGAISHLRERGFKAEDLLDTIDRDQVATLMWVGDAFARPVLETLDRGRDRWDLSSLRTIISSGVVFSAEIKQGILRHLPDVAIADVFGSSETMSLGRSITAAGKSTRTASFKAKSHTRVVTEDGRDVVPGSGERGLLAIGGRQPIGYYNDPQKTAGTFRIIDGQRYVVPGDWATVETDGTVTLIGRGSECINTGGEKVFPEEVEIVLKAHPDLADAVVIGVPDPRFGQSIVAMVEARSATRPGRDDIVEHVKSRIAAYKAPRQVHFVEAIPRLPNGKPDLRLIRDAVMAKQTGTEPASAA
ncbi:AMP-binding protein [Sphingomonas sp. CGMCC 1.13654]|uniref:AMP-binding protein n=1 Tax=Sphingomonas chungangi TaxID=2683589 RepID=A0A838L9P7_9SPHN|nr:AMP-binding protein [Sphingomonas chungangi]MBA2935279.1 AMP-binding protein [Sphingomonas chungangi]MVW56786.1 AMP-binding protein [Sphingomonas chungangi]